MDLSTIIGLVAAFGCVIIALYMDGGSIQELFAHASALILTIGGALGAAMLSFPLHATLSLPKLFVKAFVSSKENLEETIDNLVKMADKARRDGLLSLEEDAKKIEDEFMRKGVMLVVDGVDAQQVRAILESDSKLMGHRHGVGIGLLAAMGGYGPTLGIIGTVMGLINVLKQLSEPEKLGEAIGAAFLATLWGIMSANLLWLPIAAKLRSKSQEEMEVRALMTEGVLSLQAGENPRILREKLISFLPPSKRPSEEEEK
jgi:chemotaxis protein MotA